jgi:hypothetical protein
MTYTRRNIASSSPSNHDTPLSLTKNLAPPPPPPICELLPKTTPTYDFQLNIDVAIMFGKLNMMVLVTGMCKIPSMKREVFKVLKVPTLL